MGEDRDPFHNGVEEDGCGPSYPRAEGVWNRRGRVDGREEVLRGKGRNSVLPLRPCTRHVRGNGERHLSPLANGLSVKYYGFCIAVGTGCVGFWAEFHL